MAQLFNLLYGKSKSNMRLIMTDVRHKCVNYMNARKNVSGWHEIVPAEADDTVWKQKSATRGGNRCVTVRRVGKNGQTVGDAGYISKHGFNSHT